LQVAQGEIEETIGFDKNDVFCASALFASLRRRFCRGYQITTFLALALPESRMRSSLFLCKSEHRCIAQKDLSGCAAYRSPEGVLKKPSVFEPHKPVFFKNLWFLIKSSLKKPKVFDSLLRLA
jgi:hypothetical protein